MTTHVFPERCYHFLRARSGLFEPWRWSMAYGVSASRHVVVLNEDTPKSVTLLPTPEDDVIDRFYITYFHGAYQVVVINRGEPVTLHSSDGESAPSYFPYTLYTNETNVIKERGRSITIDRAEFSADTLFFRVDHFDMTPRVLADHIHADNSYLHGILAFSCDWEGSRTVELWVDGETKLAKFQNIGSGEHVLEYSIPGNAVRSWSSAGTRMVPLELRTTFNTYEQILWSGATLAVKPAVPQG